jgi:hypothetical protein
MYFIWQLYNAHKNIMDYTIKICCGAGQGIQVMGNRLAKIFTNISLHRFPE